MNDELDSPLKRRLVALEIAVPPTLVPRVMARAAMSRVRRPRLLPRLAIGALAAIVALGASAYFAPRFGQALADAPLIGSGTGPLLRSIGLAGVAGRVTAFQDSSSSSGYEIQLRGGYADATQTVILVEVHPAGRSILLTNGQLVSLTDQFGKRYELRGGVANSQTGQEVLEFDPLNGPAALLGARLSLGISNLRAFGANGNLVPGNWRLHATIALDEVSTLSSPAPGQIGTMTFSFAAVKATPTAVEVQLQVAGAEGGSLSKVIPDPRKGHLALSVRLFAPDGTEVPQLSLHISEAPGSLDAIWARTMPGPYRLMVGYEGLATFERTIVVP